MQQVDRLILEVREARMDYLARLDRIAAHQAQWKPDPSAWNLIEITEHLFWAEQGALLGMWKTLYGIRSGQVPKVRDSIHEGLTIEQIIERTWKEKEQVPPVAAPRLGGTLSFWTASLRSLQEVLESFGQQLQDEELRLQAHPHPISGPMDFQQRLEFLRFHLQRHAGQAAHLLTSMAK